MPHALPMPITKRQQKDAYLKHIIHGELHEMLSGLQ
jgi:hypothetical protein